MVKSLFLLHFVGSKYGQWAKMNFLNSLTDSVQTFTWHGILVPFNLAATELLSLRPGGRNEIHTYRCNKNHMIWYFLFQEVFFSLSSLLSAVWTLTNYMVMDYTTKRNKCICCVHTYCVCFAEFLRDHFVQVTVFTKLEFHEIHLHLTVLHKHAILHNLHTQNTYSKWPTISIVISL